MQVLTMGHVPKDLGTVRSLLAAALGTAAAPSTAAPGPPSTSAGQVGVLAVHSIGLIMPQDPIGPCWGSDAQGLQDIMQKLALLTACR